MAIEDSVCLAKCLSRCAGTSDIPRALHAFEAIRKPRTSHLGLFAIEMARVYQLPDGEDQQKRDESFRTTPFFSSSDWDGKHVDDVPGMPPDPLFFPYVLAHDVIDFVSFMFEDL
jgi:salicylate hydroxylase